MRQFPMRAISCLAALKRFCTAASSSLARPRSRFSSVAMSGGRMNTLTASGSAQLIWRAP
jgi:hypothetical protein